LFGVIEPVTTTRQGPKYMLAVHEAADHIRLLLRWRDDTGWHEVAEPMLWYIEGLVLHADGGEAPVFGRRTGALAR
jgi:hypothetical protein